MKSFNDVIGHQLLTRTMHVLTVLVIVQGMAFGRAVRDDRLLNSVLSSSGLRKPLETVHIVRERRNLHPLSRVYKRSTSYYNELINTKTSLKKLLQKLKPFTDGVPDKLKSSAPEELSKNVGTLVKIITPDAHAFVIQDVEDIIKRESLMITMVGDFLDKVKECSYIKDDAETQTWYGEQKKSLTLLVILNKMALASLLFEYGNNDVEVIDAGIGSINTGVYRGTDPHVLHQVSDLSKITHNTKGLCPRSLAYW